MKLYYFYTSIWLDFFEDRNEPSFPKGKFAKQLFEKIINENDKIIYSDLTLIELNNTRYSNYELEEMFLKFRENIVFIEINKEQIGKGKDLALKRNIPKGDAIHAVFARDNNLILVTFDRHFDQLTDITNYFKPSDLIN